MAIDIKKDGFWYKIAGYDLKKDPPNEVGLVSFLMKIIFMISLGWLLLLPAIYFHFICPTLNFKEDAREIGALTSAILSYFCSMILFFVAIMMSIVIIRLGFFEEMGFGKTCLINFGILSLVLLVIKKIILPKKEPRILVRFENSSKKSS